MTTLTQLVDRIQLLLNDAAARIWAQTDIEEWAIDGIRAYSVHFPRTRTQTFTTTAADHTYDLLGDCLGILLVEYPSGQNPPQYVKRLARTHPDFWTSDDYYDVELSNADSSAVPTLYLSASPNGTSSVIVTYAAYHAPAANSVPPPTSPITVPDHHQHIVELYAVWQAHAERLATEVQEPDTTIRLIQQYKLAVQSAEASYKAALSAAIKAEARSAWTGPWTSDNHDRIY